MLNLKLYLTLNNVKSYCKTYDIQLKSIWLQKEVRKKPHWAEEHNLEFNEQNIDG